MNLVGYTRVNTRDQDLGLQIEKLESYSCKKIFMEKQSRAKSDREELKKALEYVRPGDKYEECNFSCLLQTEKWIFLKLI
ncbi:MULTISPECIES: recombinase family protein [Bacillus cereus group]|nr:recombinase family protein [Bacillus cereus]